MPDWDGTLAEDVGPKLQVATCQGVPTSSLASTYSQSQDLITNLENEVIEINIENSTGAY